MKWLLQEPYRPVFDSMIAIAGLHVSGYEYNLQRASQFVHFFLQSKTIHAGHTQIQDQYAGLIIDGDGIEKTLRR